MHPRDAGQERSAALDLFCGAGGVSVGLHRAGFEVVGVDKRDQPRYPFEFIRADVRDLLARPWISVNPRSFDLIWASPPCQHYSNLAHRNGNADEHPDLIGPVRALLRATGVPYVIENVEGAPLCDPVTLCGSAFGLGVDVPGRGWHRLRRHRCFEASFPISAPECLCYGNMRPVIDISGGGPTFAARTDTAGGRTYKGTVAEKRKAMGIDWMTGSEIVEAIPPAYAELIAEQVPSRRAVVV